MATPETINDSPTEHHTHTVVTSEATERCPWCNQPVSRVDYNRIREEIEAKERGRLEKERARIVKTEKVLKERFERQVKAEVETAAKAAEAQVKAALANQEKIINQRLQAQRAALEKAKSAAVSAEKEKYFREKTKLEDQLQEMQRRLQKKTPNELGDEGELDLFEELKREFPNDQIERIKKGKQGGDIIHQVVYNGQICGSILLESKNTSRLMNSYITKLKEDQEREGCEHAILSTLAFPAGTSQLALRNGALICHPGRVVVLVDLLRRSCVRMHLLRASSEVRAEKSHRLYLYLTSPRSADLWAQISQATADMLDLDRAETTAHQRTWSRRADLIRAVKASTDELSSQINAHIAGGQAA